MKKILGLMCLFLLCGGWVKGQEAADGKEPRLAVSLGVLRGGGSLVGADFEFMVAKRLGLEVGAGLVGFGAAVNYHLKPTVRSSMIALQYWHQGLGEYYTQSLLGPSFVFRAKKLFTASLGLGYALEEGPNWPEDKKQPPVMLTYSLGIYLPVK